MTPTPRIVSVCYLRVASAEPQASARFASDILGLERVAEADGDIAFRSDSRFRTLSLVGGAEAQTSVGIEMWDEAALAAAESALTAAGYTARRADAAQCRTRYVTAAVLAEDGSGNAIDLVARPMQSGRRYFPSRDAGVLGLHDVALRSTAIGRDRAFWALLGATVSSYVGDITYLAIDASHHRITLYPAQRCGVLAVAFEVESLDQIMQNSYVMQERQVRIVQGPGRQPASGQIFLHLEGPDGIIYSYVHGIGPATSRGRPARQFALSPQALCAWGSVAQGVPELMAEGE